MVSQLQLTVAILLHSSSSSKGVHEYIPYLPQSKTGTKKKQKQKTLNDELLFLHDSRDCPETAVSLLHQKRLGSGSEPTKEKIKLLK